MLAPVDNICSVEIVRDGDLLAALLTQRHSSSAAPTVAIRAERVRHLLPASTLQEDPVGRLDTANAARSVTARKWPFASERGSSAG
jgi:hypothetical protein